MFRIVPAVDLKDGKCVQLRQGDERSIIFESENPLEIAKKWIERGAKALHVVDLNGSFGGKLVHEDLILRISKIAEVQVGGGIRDYLTAKNLLENGIDRVIVGTMAVENSDDVKKLAEEYPGRVIVAIDSRGGKVVTRGWKSETCLTPLELSSVYEDFDIILLFTNVDVEGLMSGIDYEMIREVCENAGKPVIVSGGFSSIDDVIKAKEAGAIGVVLGSSLYTGKLRIEELLKLEEE